MAAGRKIHRTGRQPLRGRELNGAFALNSATVTPDGEKDTLLGGGQLHWFLGEGNDNTDQTPPEILARLSKDEYWGVRGAVARNPLTPPAVLALLCESADYLVQVEATGNPSTPPAVLALLAEDPLMRWTVASNTSTPPEILDRFSKDEDLGVRSTAAGNPSTPPEALASLFEDGSWSVRVELAANTSAPPEMLARLSEDKGPTVRANVALNTSAPPETIAHLSEDGDSEVRRRAASNPSIPQDALARLSYDEFSGVRIAAAENQASALGPGPEGEGPSDEARRHESRFIDTTSSQPDRPSVSGRVRLVILSERTSEIADGLDALRINNPEAATAIESLRVIAVELTELSPAVNEEPDESALQKSATDCWMFFFERSMSWAHNLACGF